MPLVYDNKFVIIEQEKIALQKDSLEAESRILDLGRFRSGPPRITIAQFLDYCDF